MSRYIILVDTKRKYSVRTTSMEVSQKLKKLNQKLWEVAHVSGRDCKVSNGSDEKEAKDVNN